MQHIKMFLEIDMCQQKFTLKKKDIMNTISVHDISFL